MAKIGNEANLILKLAAEKAEHLKDSRVQVPDRSYIAGYQRCYDDIWMIFDGIVHEIEEKKQNKKD